MISLLKATFRVHTSNPMLSHLLTGILISVIAFLSYSNTFYATFNFDDIDNILNNSMVKTGDTSAWNLMLTSRRAVGQLSFYMNYKAGGTNVLGFHIVNLLIHAVAAYLFYLLILVTCRISNKRFTKSNPTNQTAFPGQNLAFFSALLFVAHPIQTQAVTYIVQRLTSLCTLFYLAAIIFYAVARLNAESATGEKNPNKLKVWGYIGSSLFCAILAVKTKEIAFTLPAMVLVYEFVFFQTNLKTRLKYLLLPVATPLLLLLLMVVQAINNYGIIGLRQFTRAESNISRIDYLLTQFRVITTYIRLILLPINQNIDHDYQFFTSFTLEVAASALLLSLILSGAIWLWINSHKTSSPSDSLYLRLMAFGIIWFFVTISIESSFIPIIDVMFEHRIYLPLSGALITITSAIMYGAGKLEYRFPTKPFVTGLFITLILVLAVATYKRNAVWENDLTLWKDAYSKSPNKSRVANNYAGSLILRGKGESSLPLLIKSIEQEPGYFAAWNNLARAYKQMPSLKGYYRSGFEMLSQNGEVNPLYLSKWFSNAQNNLAIAYQLQNNIPKALESYKQSLEINPSFELARSNALRLASTLPDKALSARYIEQLPKIPAE